MFVRLNAFDLSLEEEPKIEQARIMQKSAKRRKPPHFSFDSRQPHGQSSAP